MAYVEALGKAGAQHPECEEIVLIEGLCSSTMNMSPNIARRAADVGHNSTVAFSLLLYVVFITIGVLSAGCSSNHSGTTAPSPPTTATPPPSSCVSISPSQLAYSYDPVKISWGQPVNDGDTIDFFLKNTSGPFKGDVFSILLSDLKGTREYVLNPVNLRSGGYRVVYRTDSGDKEVCSTDLTFAQGDDEPTQAYLTIIGDDGLQVNWVSASSERGEVLYQKPGTTTWTTHKETSQPHTYKAEDMCNNIAIHVGYRDPGFFHSVNIPNLEPGTTVKIRNGGRESRSFTPHPRILPGDSTRHSVALLGDLGVTGVIDGGGLVSGGALMFPSLHASVPLTHLQDNERIRLTILYGDISYADGYGTFWDQFGAEMEYKFAMKAPFVTSVGNHDYVSTNNPKGWYPDFGNYNQTDSGGECGVPFTHRFAFRDGSKEPKYWYSFDSGLVHYVMMSTEHNWLNGSAQHKWLENDLANVDRKKTPWVIVTGHRAMYQSCKGFDVDDDVGRHLISDVAPVLRKHHVDVYVAGHYHLYERTAAIDGIVHVLAGSPRFMEVTSCERFKVPWYKKGVFTHGYVELDVVNSTLLNFTYWGYNATISAMAVEDSFQVSKIE